jgi:hypothetical protein
MKIEIIADSRDRDYFTIMDIAVLQDGKKLGGLSAVEFKADVDTLQPKITLKYGSGGTTLFRAIINRIFHFKPLAQELGQPLE